MGLLRTRKDVHVQEYGISRFIPTVVKMIKDIIPRITSWPYVFCNILMHQLGKSTLYHSRSYVRAEVEGAEDCFVGSITSNHPLGEGKTNLFC